MKLFITSLFMFFVVADKCFAQDSLKYKSIGIGVNYFPLMYFSLDRDNIYNYLSYGYYVGYRIEYKNKIALRTSLNFNVGNFSFKSDNIYYTYDFKPTIGMEKKILSKKKFQLTFGIDFLLYNHKTYARKSGLSPYNVWGWGVGMGPILGYHYKVNSKLCVGTEINIDFLKRVDTHPRPKYIGRANTTGWGTHRFFAVLVHYKL